MILITGSSGHLGEALVRVLRERSIGCVGVDLRPSPTTDLVGSICDEDFVRDEVFGGSHQFKGVINTAVLHKPHIETHTKQQFVDVNISGTMTLLECFAAHVQASGDPVISPYFIQTSSTTTYGGALVCPERATFIDEHVAPLPKNIYGVTKKAAEEVCFLFAKERLLPSVVVIQASRFFPEEDDDPERAAAFASHAQQLFVELFNRRVDIEDLVELHLLAAKKAEQAPLGFRRYIAAAPSPFLPLRGDDGLRRLLTAQSSAELSSLICEWDLPELPAELWREFERIAPEWAAVPPQSIDRVYCSAAAVRDLGWHCRYTARSVVEEILRRKKRGESVDVRTFDWRSDLAKLIGAKGYDVPMLKTTAA